MNIIINMIYIIIYNYYNKVNDKYYNNLLYICL